ncbi:MAG: hypothetical protein J7L53_08915 [Deltaproteobacteria bacterium]|nr:hypothetical protein [Deltaproteobacteria bacterium]
MLNEKVLARLHLEAVLPNMETMAKEDSQASKIAKKWDGSIYFIAGLSGPRVTLQINNSQVKVMPGKVGKPDIVLFFPTEKLMNNMFKGSGIGFPVPLKGFTKIIGLLTFMKLAKRMEEVLKGENPPKELKAKLTLNTIARGSTIIANYDAEGKILKEEMPKGTVEVRIKDGHAVHVVFSDVKANGAIGHAEKPNLIMEFASSDIALDVADGKVDTMAAICLGDMNLKGHLFMGEYVNEFLDKLGLYLQ